MDAIRRTWQVGGASGGDSCTGKVLDQAIKDQDEYWKKIGKKYGCKKSITEVEHEGPCKEFNSSSSYLGFLKVVVAANHSPKGNPCAQAMVSGAISQTANNTLPVVAAALGQDYKAACDKVPANERRTKSEPVVPLSPSMIGKNCLDGIKTQLMAELKGIADIAKAWYKAGFFTGVANVLSEFAHDPVGHIWDAFAATYKYYTEDFDDFSCLNNATRVDRVCKTGTKLMIAYMTGKAINFTGALVAKGGRAVGRYAANTAAGKATIAATNATKTYVAESAVGKATKAGIAHVDAAIDATKNGAIAAGKAVANSGIGKGTAAVAKTVIVKPVVGAAKVVTWPVRTAAKGVGAVAKVTGQVAMAGAEKVAEHSGNAARAIANKLKRRKAGLAETDADQSLANAERREAGKKDGSDEHKDKDDTSEAAQGENSQSSTVANSDSHALSHEGDVVAESEILDSVLLSDNLAEQIVPPEAQLGGPSKWERFKSGAKKAKNIGGTMLRGSVVGDQLEYHGKVQEFKVKAQKDKDDLKAQLDAEDAQWAKDHPDGAQPEVPQAPSTEENVNLSTGQRTP